MTDKDQDKLKDIPMPVPSYGADKPKTKPKTEAQDKIDHDSDQTIPATTPHSTGQIDTGEPSSQATSSTPVSPTPKDKSPGYGDPGASSLPFTGGDPMAQTGDGKPKPQAPKVKNPPAIPGKTSDMDIDRQISDKKTENWIKAQGSEYQVHGKFRPDAASIQGAANKNKVSSEILEATQTREYAEVIVRTHLGSQYVDTIVHHDFETSRKMLLLEMASKHPDTVSGFSDEGMPLFKEGAVFVDNVGKTKNLMYTVMHSLLADINFSIRDATTKAASAGQAKILNQDWQSEEEQEMEQNERRLVEELINSRKS